jgi:hypothetical protein
MSEGTYLGEDHRTIGIPVMGKIEDLNCNTEATEHDKSKRIEDEDGIPYSKYAELVNRVTAIERKLDSILIDLNKLYPPHEHSCLCPR